MTKVSPLNIIVANIAKQELGVKTLVTRHSDTLDFHYLSVWSIERALKRAYLAGAADYANPSVKS